MLKYRQFSVQNELNIGLCECTGLTQSGNLSLTLGIQSTLLFEPRHEETGFCICENKGADQLRGNREAGQRLCFRYTDSTIPLLSKSEISCL